jgi:type IV secretion system protein VirB2
MKPQPPITIITRRVLLAFALAILSQSALAVPGQTALNTVSQWLLTLGVIVLTIAIMWAAFGMMFQKKHFAEISHVFLGGIMFGSASTLAGLALMG